jgi:hypothetical protein
VFYVSVGLLPCNVYKDELFRKEVWEYSVA